MRILSALLWFLALPAFSHEFWIEPLTYQVDPLGNLQANLVNGQEFNGAVLPYLSHRMERFDLRLGPRVEPVLNRLGARPALDSAPLGEGLHIITYHSRMSSLTYNEWDKFLRFAAHKDFENIAERHAARGLPETGFQEGYWRFAKSLIAVGNAAGEDSLTGLEIEFVVLQNPYTEDLNEEIQVQLYYQNMPRPNAQVELFEKAPDGTVVVSLHRTNEAGIAALPVRAGHSYLVDSVVLRVPDQALEQSTGIEWETLWAALTFAVPTAR